MRPRRTRRRAPAGWRRPGTAPARRAGPRARPSSPGERAHPAQLELGLALAEARLGEGADQSVEVLRRYEPADRQDANRAGRPRPGRGPYVSRGPRSEAPPRTRSGSTPISRSRSRPCEDATMNPAARGASARCRRSCRARQPGVAPRGELAEDHERHPVAPRPRERAHRGRSVLPAHHAVRPRPRERPPDAARNRDRSATRPRMLPGLEDLATVTLCVGEPALGLVPTGLARGEVHHMGNHVAAVGERTEERVAVGNRDRRQDRDAGRHRRNFALWQGSQTFSAPEPGTMFCSGGEPRGRS